MIHEKLKECSTPFGVIDSETYIKIPQRPQSVHVLNAFRRHRFRNSLTVLNI